MKKSSNALVVYTTDEQPKKYNSLYNASKKASEEIFSSYKSENERLGVQVYIHRPKPMDSGIRLKLYPGEDKSRLAHTQAEALKLKEKITAIISTIGISA